MCDLSSLSAWDMEEKLITKYIQSVADILAEYSWIYEERNTEVVLRDVLQKIPSEWLKELTSLTLEELCQLPFKFFPKEEWPITLKTFVKDCQYLGQFRFPSQNFQEFEKASNKGSVMIEKVAFKKQYEIEILSTFINKICREHNCSVVLDIGSGLGYLDQLLHLQFALKCIGLDSSPKYTQTAKERIKTDPCMDLMHHQTLKIEHSENCLQDIKSILKEQQNINRNCIHSRSQQTLGDNSHHSNSAPVVMVGLHSCGNLAQDMMKLFFTMEEVSAFICVGCCYNKINLNDFPMSVAAKDAVSSTRTRYSKWLPCVSGLRLAAHGVRPKIVDDSRQSIIEKSLFYRALFESYIRKGNISWQQPKRHVRSADILDFDTYCRNMLKNHSMGKDEKVLRDLNALFKEKEHLFPRVRVLLVLQTLLQPLWEGFVTVDRMLYFKEKSIKCEVLALWSEAKSSRNLALCAYKR